MCLGKHQRVTFQLVEQLVFFSRTTNSVCPLVCVFVSECVCLKGIKVEMNCLSNRWSHQSSSPLTPPSSGALSLSQEKGNHLWLRAQKLTRWKYPKQWPAGTQKGHVFQLKLSPLNLNHLLLQHQPIWLNQWDCVCTACRQIIEKYSAVIMEHSLHRF